MKNIKWKSLLVVCGVITTTLLTQVEALDTINTTIETQPTQKTTKYSELLMSRSEAEIYVNAFIYMLDLDLTIEQFGDEYYNLDVLNQDYVNCFDIEYLDQVLKRQHFNEYLTFSLTEEEAEYENYLSKKYSHEMMTAEELRLLDEYNKYRYQEYKIYENNIDIIQKIGEKNGMTIEDMKSYKNGTPRSYDMFLGSDEEYSHLLEYAYISIPQDVSVYWIEKRAYNSYPFSYYVDNGYDDPFYTSHYDASLYGFDYPSATGEFFSMIPDRIPDEDGIFFKNERYLLDYTVYNNCIELKVVRDPEIMSYFDSYIMYFTDGKITSIEHYEYSKLDR